ncbi:thiol reductant ABC exporter subunit CydC [Sciscionella marina]|uniref:thiol reductant ABC exporter subunit CydC n=1 Tax=Sciscionella marina TaxID=508770 RepID=UPI00035D8A46|nr:thiol reductant ABC exporter subunit CydC [Sciscionella marina]
MKTGKGALGALPALSPATRTALLGYGLVLAVQALAVIGFAWGLSSTLGSLVAGRPEYGPLWIVALSVLARGLLGWAGQVIATRAAARAKRELRAGAVSAVLRGGPEFIAGHGSAELSYRCTTALEAIDEYFTTFLPALVASVVLAPGIGIAILAFDPASALIIVLTIPLLPVFAILIGWYTEKRVRAAGEDSERLAAHLGELIRALGILTAFGHAKAQTRAVQRVSERQHRSAMRTLRVAFCSSLALEVVSSISVALVAVGIGLRLSGGEVDLGTGLFVLILAPECYLALRKVGLAFHASADGLSAVDKIAELQDVGVAAAPDGVLPGPLRHQLRVRGLRVQRRAGYTPDGIDLTLVPGTVTKLETPSGSGKSSTMAVLLGFAHAADGTVTVDGTELREHGAWRRNIAWIPQRPEFLGPTVADELRRATADQERQPSAERVLAVCELVHAHQLLDSDVDTLSAGQRARVAIAAALLRVEAGATVLLADEPVAHLDAVTANAAMSAIERCGAAVLLAAHRTVAPAEPIDTGTVNQPAALERTPVKAPNALRLLGIRSIPGIAVGVLAAACGIALTATSAWLIARAAGQPPILTLTVAIVGVRTFGLGKGVLRYTERLATHNAAFRTATLLRTRLWSALARIGPAAVRGREQAQRMVTDIDTVRDGIPRVLQPPIVAAVVGAAAVATQSAILPAAGLALAIALLAACVLGPVLGSVFERRATEALAADKRTLAVRVGELFGHAAPLLATGSDRLWHKDIRETDERLLRQARQQAFGAGIASAIATIALGAAATVSVLLGAGTDPVLVAVLALLPLACNEIVEPLGGALTRARPLRASAARIAETLETPEPERSGVQHGEDIELIDADLGWPGAEPVLRGVNLRIPQGSTVAILGPSGAGKSTLLAALLGFIAPRKGIAVIPETVAVAPQDPQLVSTTLAENLRLGDPHAGPEQLRAALGTAQLPGFTGKLEDRIGPDTVSGGEASRISLARALLAAPRAEAVLLDEPTAHLDRPTARNLLAELEIALLGRTVIHVTHHPDEVRSADLVFDVRENTVRLLTDRISTRT